MTEIKIWYFFDVLLLFYVNCGPLWPRCGPLWFVVVRCGPLRSVVAPLWFVVVRCGPLWSVVVRCGSLWSVVVISHTDKSTRHVKELHLLLSFAVGC